MEDRITKKIFYSTVVLSLLLMIGHYVHISMIVLGALMIISLITFATETYLYLPIMLYFLTWSGVMRVSASSYSFYTIIQTLYIGLYIFKTKDTMKIPLRFRSVATFIVLVLNSFVAILIHNYSFSLGYINFIMMLFFVPLYLFNEKKIDFKICSYFYICGTVTSSFAGLLFLNKPHMRSFISISEHIHTGVNRLDGLSGDSNGYAAELLAAIGLSLLFLSKKSKIMTKLLLGCAILICTYFGFMTVSKSFILMLALTMFLWIYNLISDPKRKNKGLIIGLVIVALTIFLCLPQTSDLISMYITRFTEGGATSDMSSGRVDIWQRYISKIFSDWTVLLFGNGFINSARVEIGGNWMAAHNTVIQIIFQFGLIGTTAFVLWIYSLSNSMNTKRIWCFQNIFLIIILFASWLALDKVFFDDFFFFIMLYMVSCSDYFPKETDY